MHTVAELRNGLREQILSAAKAHGAYNVRLTGPTARGESDETDFLVELEPDRNLNDLAGLLMDLIDLLGPDVYVITEGGIKDHYKPILLDGAEPL